MSALRGGRGEEKLSGVQEGTRLIPAMKSCAGAARCGAVRCGWRFATGRAGIHERAVHINSLNPRTRTANIMSNQSRVQAYGCTTVSVRIILHRAEFMWLLGGRRKEGGGEPYRARPARCRTLAMSRAPRPARA